MTNEELDSALKEGILQREKMLDQLVKICTSSDAISKETTQTIATIEGNRKLVMQEYIKHLDDARECNKRLMSIIKSQQATIQKLEAELEAERKRNNEIIDKLIHTQHPTVQVHQT